LKRKLFLRTVTSNYDDDDDDDDDDNDNDYSNNGDNNRTCVAKIQHALSKNINKK